MWFTNVVDDISTTLWTNTPFDSTAALPKPEGFFHRLVERAVQMKPTTYRGIVIRPPSHDTVMKNNWSEVDSP